MMRMMRMMLKKRPRPGNSVISAGVKKGMDVPGQCAVKIA
jgi:hypothetical protein